MNSLFGVHKLNAVGLVKAKKIAEAFDALLEEVLPFCHGSRESAIMKTKLEEACFFAKKSMAVDSMNQEP